MITTLSRHAKHNAEFSPLSCHVHRRKPEVTTSRCMPFFDYMELHLEVGW